METRTPQKAQWGRICLPVHEEQEMPVQPLSGKDPLEWEVATHPNILDWKIPWTEEPGRLQSTGSQRVRHDSAQHTPFPLGIRYKTLQICAIAPPFLSHPPLMGPVLDVIHSPQVPGTQVLPPSTKAWLSPVC